MISIESEVDFLFPSAIPQSVLYIHDARRLSWESSMKFVFTTLSILDIWFPVSSFFYFFQPCIIQQKTTTLNEMKIEHWKNIQWNFSKPSFLKHYAFMLRQFFLLLKKDSEEGIHYFKTWYFFFINFHGFWNSRPKKKKLILQILTLNLYNIRYK